MIGAAEGVVVGMLPHTGCRRLQARQIVIVGRPMLTTSPLGVRKPRSESKREIVEDFPLPLQATAVKPAQYNGSHRARVHEYNSRDVSTTDGQRWAQDEQHAASSTPLVVHLDKLPASFLQGLLFAQHEGIFPGGTHVKRDLDVCMVGERRGGEGESGDPKMTHKSTRRVP